MTTARDNMLSECIACTRCARTVHHSYIYSRATGKFDRARRYRAEAWWWLNRARDLKARIDWIDALEERAA